MAALCTSPPCHRQGKPSSWPFLSNFCPILVLPKGVSTSLEDRVTKLDQALKPRAGLSLLPRFAQPMALSNTRFEPIFFSQLFVFCITTLHLERFGSGSFKWEPPPLIRCSNPLFFCSKFIPLARKWIVTGNGAFHLNHKKPP